MLELNDVTKSFGGIRVLDHVSMRVAPGEVLGLVGMSGSGKSTIAKCVLGLQSPDSGTIAWRGRDLAARDARRTARRHIQGVFQDPRASLNPRWTVRRILCEPLDNWFAGEARGRREAKLHDLLDRVALTRDLLDRNPHELSTGQCQQICLARALALEPALLILDEPLSALDVCVQAQLIDLLRDLNAATGVGFLFISHDIAIVADLCRSVLVLRAGEIVERGPVDRVFQSPKHPYSQALMHDARGFNE